MFVPGIIITLLTFPGVIVHELAHQLFCRLFRVPVFEVVYFRVGNPAGYVLHEAPGNRWHSMMISIGPFFVNTLLGALIAMPAALPLFAFHNAGPIDYVLIYVGVSIAMHAFPSTGDASALWSALGEEGTPFLAKVAGYPIIGLIYIGAIGSFFWLDLAYGIGVAIGFPKLLASMLA